MAKYQIPESEIDYRAMAGELMDDKSALQAQLDGNIPSATFWLQHKVDRQAAALDALNRKVITQRFVLRETNRLGRGLTREEYLQARKEVENEQLRDRIAEEPPAV